MNIKSTIFTKACIRFVKNNTVLEEECFTVPIEELQKAYDAAFPELVKVNWNYNETTESLNLELYKERTDGLDLRIRVMNSSKILTEETINTTESRKELVLYVPKENLVLTIDDFYAKEQVVVKLELDPSEFDLVQEEGETALSECTNGVVCEAGTVCDSQTITSTTGACCTTSCVAEIVSEGELMLFGVPFIFWIAIIILIGSIAVLGNTINVVKKGGRK